MPTKKLKDFLESHNVKYEIIPHAEAFTAQEIAASAHVPGKELAKTVMVKLDGTLAMAVLPATYKVDFDLLKSAAGANKVELAKEQETTDIFPDCDTGAMPPFGNLYGIYVFVAEKLAEDEYIAFNAGSHKELMRLSFKDFERLVKPKIVKISLGA